MCPAAGRSSGSAALSTSTATYRLLPIHIGKKQSLDAVTVLSRLSQIMKHPLLSSCHDGAENHVNMTQINISLRLPAVQNDAQQQAWAEWVLTPGSCFKHPAATHFSAQSMWERKESPSHGNWKPNLPQETYGASYPNGMGDQFVFTGDALQKHTHSSSNTGWN